MFWKVRATPYPVITSGRDRVMSRAPSTIRPWVGRYSPVSMLNRVVFPAPFGPISETIECSGKVDRDVVDGHQPPELLGDALRAQDRGTERSGRSGVPSGAAPSPGGDHAVPPAPPGASASCASSAAISAVSSSRRRRSGIRPCGRSTIMITSRNPKIPNSTWVS